ncbi:DNA polymerase-3 subunit epsilon [Lewinella aquimaris]|uniref:DNA polymerase-3 subunit epsilon n=1 Tax=Neolewinella aquimaris TaxID=1835722 RepID=A0A840DX18_9BACT|nr:3'-5' exonuclease [Neolewinella aquimaris]MBB4077764.1 DNA polymerase-3 subunit epsilon [Neolewinella aquimaris]
MEGKEWLNKLRARFTGAGNDDWPDWYRTYRQRNATPPAPSRLVSELPIVVLDAETTGLDIRQDRMLCLGGLRVHGNSISLREKFEAYLHTPPGHDGKPAVSIHGIIPNSHRYTYVKEPKLLADLLEYVGDAVIVGHHIGFDVEMINRSLQRNGAGPLVNRVIDTSNLAKRLRPAGYWTPENDYSLDALARRYRIPLSDRHTALGDCYITAVLWLKLLTRLAVKLGHDLRMEDL